jgi:hypothetical protein
MRDHRLSGVNVERTSLVFDAKHSFQHDREFVKFRRLSGLDPFLWTAHVRDARGCRLGVNAADIFVDELRLVPGRLDTSRLCDEGRHKIGRSLPVAVQEYTSLHCYVLPRPVTDTDMAWGTSVGCRE